MSSIYIVIQYLYSNLNASATRKLANAADVLNSQVQYFEHYANKIKLLLEQSQEFSLVEIGMQFQDPKNVINDNAWLYINLMFMIIQVTNTCNGENFGFL